ncbi:MAG: HAD family hydrolase [Treponema sp.]|jgi:putative hydrolase of the HAD superfamily|nr:HAD family hydrolase [Treponema sp.]
MKIALKAVAFDIDGTLYSDWSLYLRIIPYVIKHLSFFLAYDRVRKTLRRTAPLADFFEYQARLLAEELHIASPEARELIDRIIYQGLKPYFKKIKPYAHSIMTVRAFYDAGLKIAILSDFPPAQKGDIWGLAQFCDVILGSEEIGALKPSKYAFGILANTLEMLPEEILYVGNSIASDIQGAHNAGMKTAYRLPLWRKITGKIPVQADISFRNYRQLQKFVLQ